MKKNIKNGLALSIVSLVVGFFAIAVPFKFFENLTSNQMTIMFATEIIVYTLVGMIFLIAKQMEADRKQKEQEQNEQRRAKISKLNTEWLDLVA